MVTVCTLDISMRFENSHNELFNRRLLSHKWWGSTEAGRTVSAGWKEEGTEPATETYIGPRLPSKGVYCSLV